MAAWVVAGEVLVRADGSLGSSRFKKRRSATAKIELWLSIDLERDPRQYGGGFLSPKRPYSVLGNAVRTTFQLLESIRLGGTFRIGLL